MHSSSAVFTVHPYNYETYSPCIYIYIQHCNYDDSNHCRLIVPEWMAARGWGINIRPLRVPIEAPIVFNLPILGRNIIGQCTVRWYPSRAVLL